MPLYGRPLMFIQHTTFENIIEKGIIAQHEQLHLFKQHFLFRNIIEIVVQSTGTFKTKLWMTGVQR